MEESTLGQIAMEFRGDANPQKRLFVALKYELEVNRLIATKNWKDIPAPEDMLPDAWMPLAFYKHWKL